MRWFAALMLLAVSFGCARSQPAVLGTAEMAALDAVVRPPAGWRAEPLKTDARSTHQTWVSPTGQTAYGVIRFSLPLPLGRDIALWGFISEMKRSEGDAALLKKYEDPQSGLLRFEAEGGLYRIDGIILTRGFRGWVAYLGLLRDGQILLDELALAVQARENTRFGLDRRDQAQGNKPTPAEEQEDRIASPEPR